MKSNWVVIAVEEGARGAYKPLGALRRFFHLYLCHPDMKRKEEEAEAEVEKGSIFVTHLSFLAHQTSEEQIQGVYID